MKVPVTISAQIDASLDQVWLHFTAPESVMSWNTATPDWHCPEAENDLRVGGRFRYKMAAKDGSFEFDFSGQYNEVIEGKSIRYTMDDDRTVDVKFEIKDGKVLLTQTFEAEAVNDVEMQRAGWQSILNNFKAFCES